MKLKNKPVPKSGGRIVCVWTLCGLFGAVGIFVLVLWLLST